MENIDLNKIENSEVKATVEIKKVTLYYQVYGDTHFCLAEAEHAEHYYQGEICINGRHFENALLTENRDLYGVDYKTLDPRPEIEEDAYVCYRCYIDDKDNVKEIEDGEYFEFEDCNNCPYFEKCKAAWGIKVRYEPLEVMINKLINKNEEKYCEIYFDGQNQTVEWLDKKIDLKLEKLKEFDEIDNDDIQKPHYDFWKESDTGNIWIRRIPGQCFGDYFTTWENLESTDINNLKNRIEELKEKYK
jgi:hypothetical protein